MKTLRAPAPSLAHVAGAYLDSHRAQVTQLGSAANEIAERSGGKLEILDSRRTHVKPAHSAPSKAHRAKCGPLKV